jgi:hypothetical protein
MLSKDKLTYFGWKMAQIYDIRNLRTPQDLERKRADFFRTLRLQAKLNRDYEDSMIARQQIDKMGLTPMLDIPHNAESERQEVMLQYDIALKHLKSVMPDQQALNAIGRLTDQEVLQLNSQWGNIESYLESKRTIMSGQFFVMYFRRHMQALEQEGLLGAEIPLLDSTFHQLPQDVKALWLEFARGNINSQTGKGWSLDQLIGITANAIQRSRADIASEIQNRMAFLSRYAPARIAATSYFEKPKREQAKKGERESYEKVLPGYYPIVGENATETFATEA